MVLRFTGERAARLFAPEAGGHRWQRVPPTEKRGRVQTSSVTVAIIPESNQDEIEIRKEDIRIDTYVAQGPGGQSMQKNETAVRVTHIPTGAVACCQSERSQHRNKENALRVLTARIKQTISDQKQTKENANRRNQIGQGYRGDKIRTVQMQNDRVTNHLNGKKLSAKRYLKGYIEDIQ